MLPIHDAVTMNGDAASAAPAAIATALPNRRSIHATARVTKSAAMTSAKKCAASHAALSIRCSESIPHNVQGYVRENRF